MGCLKSWWFVSICSHVYLSINIVYNMLSCKWQWFNIFGGVRNVGLWFVMCSWYAFSLHFVLMVKRYVERTIRTLERNCAFCMKAQKGFDQERREKTVHFWGSWPWSVRPEVPPRNWKTQFCFQVYWSDRRANRRPWCCSYLLSGSPVRLLIGLTVELGSIYSCSLACWFDRGSDQRTRNLTIYSIFGRKFLE